MRILLEKSTDRNGVTYSSLTVGCEYVVLGIESDWYRILDDSGSPVLFEPSCFSISDPSEPSFWQSSIGECGERYAYLPAWNKAGFFEDVHDGVKSAQMQFRHDLLKYFPTLDGGKA